MDNTTVSAPVSGDADLVQKARTGDLVAFERLVRLHTPTVYAHALRFFDDPTAAEDIVQEVFIKVYRALGDFDGRSRFSTWLFRVTHNTCLDHARAGRRRPIPIDPLTVELTDPDRMDDRTALSATVEKALRTLAPDDREALQAVSIFGLTYAEAGAEFGVPAGTVKSRVFRARRALASILGGSAGGLQ
ncbi:MAG: sigma-70 family RNA polymerase sigma factor [Coriobacteriia bacterium]|nr:sigma-70 family RNA polymerase sigma factor [Coriobacteriia bacterium]